MNLQEFRRIQVHIRFLKRNGNISKYSHRVHHSETFTIYPDEDIIVHPFDIDDLWLMRESLAHMKLRDFEREGFDLSKVQLAIHDLDELLGVMEIC